jgi:arylsulfatase
MADMPNVLFIVWDAVRAQNTSLLDYERDVTPTLADLADETVQFTEARAPAPWTLPSHASIFTGLLPSQHATTSGSLRFTHDGRHLASRLSDARFNTGLFTSNTYLGSPEFNLSTGFDFKYTTSGDVPFPEGIDPDAFAKMNGTGAYLDFLRAAASHSYPMRSILNGVVNKALTDVGSSGDRHASAGEAATYVDAFFDWLDTVDGPFFGFLNLMDAHAPYVPPDEYTHFAPDSLEDVPQTPPWQYLNGEEPVANLSTLCDLYDGCIQYLDAKLREMYNRLADRGLLDDTILVVAGDHGEAFGERAEACRDGVLYGHTVGVEEVLVHVPLVVRFPSARHGGSTVESLVSLKDVYHTLLHETGVESVDDDRSLLHPGTPGLKWTLSEWHGLTDNARSGAAEYDVDLDRYDQELFAYYEPSADGIVKCVWNGDGCERIWRLADRANVGELPIREGETIRDRRLRRVGQLQPVGDGASGPVKVSDETLEDLEELGYI